MQKPYNLYKIIKVVIRCLQPDNKVENLANPCCLNKVEISVSQKDNEEAMECETPENTCS